MAPGSDSHRTRSHSRAASHSATPSLREAYSHDEFPAAYAGPIAHEDPERLGVPLDPVPLGPADDNVVAEAADGVPRRAPDMPVVVDMDNKSDGRASSSKEPEHETEEIDPEAYGAPSETGSSSSVVKSSTREQRAPLQRETTNMSTLTASSTAYSTVSARTQTFEKGSWLRWLMFKRRRPPPVPKDRTVSPEYTASKFSQATFNWITPLMSVGYERPLELNDIYLVNPNRSADRLSTALKANFAKRRQNKEARRPLLMALYDTVRIEFWIGGICQLIASIVQTINPFVLKYLIRFAEDAYIAHFEGGPAPAVGHGVGLVVGVSCLQIIQNMCTNQFMYRGMIVGAQSRAAMIACVFDKAMTISGRAKSGGRPLDDEDDFETPPENLEPGSEAEKNWFKRKLSRKDKQKKPKPPASGQHIKPGILGDGQGYGNGRIVNLMSVDTYRIDQASGMFHMLWTAPVSIVLTLILLLINLTYSALAGFAFFVIVMPLLTKAIESLRHRRMGINKLTDQRVSLTQEILQSVRFVKFFGWEMSFLDRLSALRKKEIFGIQKLMAIRNGVNAIGMSVPVFASMLAFITFAYTHTDFNPAPIFSSLALFNSLRLPLNMLPLVLGQVVDAVNSIQRIQEFLMAEDTQDEAEWDYGDKNAVEVVGGSFIWERVPTKPDGRSDKQKKAEARRASKDERRKSKASSKGGATPVVSPTAATFSPTSPMSPTSPATPITPVTPVADEEEIPFSINDINLKVGRNELIAIIGSVGSGKSSLLSALAGDMRRTAGTVKLGASRAFCPQYAWIQNATLRENVLFGKDLKRKWYDEVVDACALRADLAMLPDGDGTEIGERGITVSGGQKQRLNIARAIYFDSDIILMDDPLSAVDAHVGRHIMDNAICGLLANKCRILATHQLWVLNRCDRIVWMDQGRIIAIDTFDNLMKSNKDFVDLIANNAQESEEKKETSGEEEIEDKKKEKKEKPAKKSRTTLMQAEERAVSSVSFKVYLAYARAAGSVLVIPLVLFLVILSQAANITTSLWLSWWTSGQFGFSRSVYVGGYAALGVFQALALFLMSIAITIFGTRASKVMLQNAITHTLRAPMSFFDTTPLGRITNRFSKDIDTMDNMLTDSLRFFFLTMGMIVSVFILIIVYYHFFLVALAPLMIIFIFSAGYYRASAREVKRHEAVLRSDVFSRFSEAVSGTSTIRAYGLEDRFSAGVKASIDNMNSAYYLTFANQRWLSVRLDVIGNLLVFVTGILVVTSRFSVNPSTGGLVLSYILTIVQMIQFTVRQLAEVENNMNSTERIHYYGTALEQEAPLHLPNPEVTADWPQRGEVKFNTVDMRYRDGLPLVLQQFSLHVRGGERIGVIGRTGAGKSSIMSTLFRIVELSGGSITIDGVDISRVGLADLRSRLAIIPQDPTLFVGTVRSNLDPFGKYTDLQLWQALRQADLVGDDTHTQVPQTPVFSIGGKDSEKVIEKDVDSPGSSPPSTAVSGGSDAGEGGATSNAGPGALVLGGQSSGSGRITLDSPVEEEGRNFSLGQRQLMALARALVRNSQIIVCDEATSSVDMNTDEKVQRTLDTGFRGKTLLCIAHRLKTIVRYDRILVMDQGRVAELGTPKELWARGPSGIFRSMCARSSIRYEDLGVGWPVGESEKMIAEE